MKIPAYIINLKRRTDRKKHILKEFSQFPEFSPVIIEACENSRGNVGLWDSIKGIIASQHLAEQDFVIICEDDHQFFNGFSLSRLNNYIGEARMNDADVLLGGISWFSNGFSVSENLYWVEVFSGTQFMVIFKKFFPSILNATFGSADTADYKICSLTQKKFFTYPFISIQHDFGYSDATSINNKAGRVKKLFERTVERLDIMQKVKTFYNEASIPPISIGKMYTANLSIPAYVLFQKSNAKSRNHVANQFSCRKEFELHLLFANAGNAFRKKRMLEGLHAAVEDAIKNGDDFIVVCKENHTFTKNYSKEALLKTIIESNQLGCDLLIGACSSFDLAIPIKKNLLWTNHFLSFGFMVIFRRIFKKILDEPIDCPVSIEVMLSEITSNKMLTFPFVSRGEKTNDQSFSLPQNSVFSVLRNIDDRIGNIQKAYLDHQSKLSGNTKSTV